MGRLVIGGLLEGCRPLGCKLSSPSPERDTFHAAPPGTGPQVSRGVAIGCLCTGELRQQGTPCHHPTVWGSGRGWAAGGGAARWFARATSSGGPRGGAGEGVRASDMRGAHVPVYSRSPEREGRGGEACPCVPRSVPGGRYRMPPTPSPAPLPAMAPILTLALAMTALVASAQVRLTVGCGSPKILSTWAGGAQRAPPGLAWTQAPVLGPPGLTPSHHPTPQARTLFAATEEGLLGLDTHVDEPNPSKKARARVCGRCRRLGVGRPRAWGGGRAWVGPGGRPRARGPGGRHRTRGPGGRQRTRSPRP